MQSLVLQGRDAHAGGSTGCMEAVNWAVYGARMGNGTSEFKLQSAAALVREK